MRQVRWASWLTVTVLGVTIGGLQISRADVVSDQAAAIVNYPIISVSDNVDTVIQLSNTSNTAIDVHCFYENANSRCSNTGEPCESSSDCEDGGSYGSCDPADNLNETDFKIRLTPRQPIGWLASEGLSEFKIDGVTMFGRDGSSSNAGSRIPPVAEIPYVGTLKCIAVKADGTPSNRNDLIGNATIEYFDSQGQNHFDVAQYNAIGSKSVGDWTEGDNELMLGGESAEYEGCPSTVYFNHFFDLAENPASDANEQITTNLVLMPCTQDYLRQPCAAAVVQYLVYNEFEQRFSTSRTVKCLQNLQISKIDTTQTQRSIFSAGVAGTLTGQSHLKSPVVPADKSVGVIGIAIERHGDYDTNSQSILDPAKTAAYNLTYSYKFPRVTADVVTLP